KQQKRVKPFKNRCFYDSDARFSELICKIDKFARLSDFVQRFLRYEQGRMAIIYTARPIIAH
ncbi:hypothetical protein JTM27_32125, partial [Pseudomonas aeruginosa]|nr:hypothetical protein [Pseudomonas aeruginosa]MBN0712032.1 hypothetical protein [Pseudomonas aeruginosa]